VGRESRDGLEEIASVPPVGRQHRKLRQESGGYVFVLYRPVGRGIRVLKMRSLNARGLRLEFYGAGRHPKGRQMKVPPGRVFG